MKNLAEKIRLPAFVDDLLVLLPPGATFDMRVGASRERKDPIVLLHPTVAFR